MKETQTINTLRTQQYKYSVTGESVNEFKSYKRDDLTPKERIERMEKNFNALVYFAVALGVAVVTLLITR